MDPDIKLELIGDYIEIIGTALTGLAFLIFISRRFFSLEETVDRIGKDITKHVDNCSIVTQRISEELSAHREGLGRHDERLRTLEKGG